jgi:hypothetical protein
LILWAVPTMASNMLRLATGFSVNRIAMLTRILEAA